MPTKGTTIAAIAGVPPKVPSDIRNGMTADEFARTIGATFLRSVTGITKAYGHGYGPDMVSEYDWPRKENGGRWDRTLVFLIYRDASWSVSLKTAHSTNHERYDELRQMAKVR